MRDWEWIDDPNTLATFIHILLLANWKDKKWRGILIKRGSFITSVAGLAKSVGISVQQTRTAIERLISTNEITKSSTSKYTVISVNNYEKYQMSTKSLTNEQQTNNKRITTTEEDKKIRVLDKSNTDGSHGDAFINQIMGEFAERFGHNPTDPKPRYEAYNLIRQIKSFLKEIGREQTDELVGKVIKKYFSWLDEQDWFSAVQGIGTIRRKFEIYKSQFKANVQKTN